MALLLAVLHSAGCSSLPPPPRLSSTAVTADEASALGRTGTMLLSNRPAPETGARGSGATEELLASVVVPLASGADALAARLMVIERAERTVDIQYYIFRPDASGRALLTALQRAAERGVRVRLMLDAWGERPDPHALAALAAQERIEIRLYNPLTFPRSTMLSLLFDFERTQRRMHNKLLVADGRAAIVGGRNVGDEYFAQRNGLEYGDLDVLVFGPVLPEFGAGFDQFWNEADVAVIGGSPAAAGTTGSTAPIQRRQPQAEAPAVAWQAFEARLHAGALPTYHGPATAVQDLPDKADPARAAAEHHLGHEIARVMKDVRSELVLISAYFMPGAAGVEQMRALRQRGVRVVVVTNSLAATDVPAVHAGYLRHRKALLKAGVELYELRADPGVRASRLPATGSSRVSLHAKVMVADRAMLFVGSMNIDPRSVLLNTENGVVLASPQMADDLVAGLQRTLADGAWRLALQDGQVIWRSRRDNVDMVKTAEPDAGLWLRLQAALMSWLPIDRLL